MDRRRFIRRGKFLLSHIAHLFEAVDGVYQMKEGSAHGK